jgi:hypothetical protein
VQTRIDAYAATKGSTSTSPMDFTLSVNDSKGATIKSFTVEDAASSGPVAPTSGQVSTITADTIGFYNHKEHGLGTSADLSKLVTDYTGLAVPQPTLAQILAAALQSDCGSNAGVLAGDLAGRFASSINNDNMRGGSGLSSDINTMMSQTVQVGMTYRGLVAHESPTQALNQTIALYHFG